MSITDTPYRAPGVLAAEIATVDHLSNGRINVGVGSGWMPEEFAAASAAHIFPKRHQHVRETIEIMPVAPSSVLTGQAVSSTLSTLFSCSLVIVVALLVGFRPAADAVAWLWFGGLLALLVLATTWLAIFFGLLAKTSEGAGAFSYLLLLLIFISPSFVPTDSMTPWLRSVAQHQPMTPIIEAMRSLLTEGTPGPHVWAAFAWAAGILVASSTLALGVYRRSTPVAVS